MVVTKSCSLNQMRKPMLNKTEFVNCLRTKTWPVILDFALVSMPFLNVIEFMDSNSAANLVISHSVG